jgi:acetyl esterase/lipase
LKIIFGGANQPETQPIAYVSAGVPPALLLTGATDGMVNPGNATRLAARLAAAGNEAAVMTYPRVGHLTIMAAFARPFRFLAPAMRDTDAFMARVIRARTERRVP